MRNKSFTPGHSQQASNIHRSCAVWPCGEQPVLTQTLDSLQKVGQSPRAVYHSAPLRDGGNGSYSSQMSRQPWLSGSWASSHTFLPACDETVPHEVWVSWQDKTHHPDSWERSLIKSADIDAGSDCKANDDFVKDRPHPLISPRDLPPIFALSSPPNDIIKVRLSAPLMLWQKLCLHISLSCCSHS